MTIAAPGTARDIEVLRQQARMANEVVRVNVNETERSSTHWARDWVAPWGDHGVGWMDELLQHAQVR